MREAGPRGIVHLSPYSLFLNLIEDFFQHHEPEGLLRYLLMSFTCFWMQLYVLWNYLGKLCAICLSSREVLWWLQMFVKSVMLLYLESIVEVETTSRFTRFHVCSVSQACWGGTAASPDYWLCKRSRTRSQALFFYLYDYRTYMRLLNYSRHCRMLHNIYFNFVLARLCLFLGTILLFLFLICVWEFMFEMPSNTFIKEFILLSPCDSYLHLAFTTNNQHYSSLVRLLQATELTTSRPIRKYNFFCYWLRSEISFSRWLKVCFCLERLG